MMLIREVNHHIEDFYKTSKNALLLTGARQTGKTYADRIGVRRFTGLSEFAGAFHLAAGIEDIQFFIPIHYNH